MRENACVGCLTASASHELQNALAVIRESAGLMQDLIALGGENIPRRERIVELLSLIQQQVARGGELAGGLNTLGHAWEEDDGDLARILEEFVILAGRMGRMRSVTVGLAPGESGLRAPSAGLALRVLLFDLLQTCLEEAPGCALTFAPARRDGIPGIHLRVGLARCDATTDVLRRLDAQLARLGARKEPDNGHGTAARDEPDGVLYYFTACPSATGHRA